MNTRGLTRSFKLALLMLKNASRNEGIIISFQDDEDKKRFSFPVDALDIYIGRGIENDINIKEASVSRRHAHLWSADGRLWVSDEGSTNGITINGVRIRDVSEIDEDSSIKIGNVGLKIEYYPAEENSRTHRAAHSNIIDYSAVIIGIITILSGLLLILLGSL